LSFDYSDLLLYHSPRHILSFYASSLSCLVSCASCCHVRCLYRCGLSSFFSLPLSLSLSLSLTLIHAHFLGAYSRSSLDAKNHGSLYSKWRFDGSTSVVLQSVFLSDHIHKRRRRRLCRFKCGGLGVGRGWMTVERNSDNKYYVVY